MDDNSLRFLRQTFSRGSAPPVIDVRRAAAFQAADSLTASAFHGNPEDVGHWRRNQPAGRPVGVTKPLTARG